MASPPWEASKVFLSEGLKGIGSRGCTMVLQQGLLFLSSLCSSWHHTHPWETPSKFRSEHYMLETELLTKGKD